MTIDAFYGEVTDPAAKIYLRAPRTADRQRWVGTVSGPYSAQSSTLPAYFDINDLGPGETVMGAATVVDPCCWSPELSVHYQVDAQLMDGPTVVANLTRRLGIKRFGCQGLNFRVNAERWVLRGVSNTFASATLDEFSDTRTTLVVTDPTVDQLNDASAVGVPVLVEFSTVNGLPQRLAELACFEAVTFVVVPNDAPPAVREQAPNLLFGTRRSDDGADWFDFWLIAATDLLENSIKTQKPAVVFGDHAAASFAEARRACDRLQARTAASGDFAGYIGTYQVAE